MATALQWFRKLIKKILSQEWRRRSPWRRDALLLERLEDRVVPSYTFSDLASFNGANGAYPNGRLVEDSSGNLFGTSSGGGTNGTGTVFEWVKSSGTISVLASFNGSDETDPSFPVGDLVEDSSGNLFGTTDAGGFPQGFGTGTVFEWVMSSGTILAKFSNSFIAGAAGTYPRSLVEDSSGNLFGIASGGGTNGAGTLFEITSSGTFSDLANFNGTNGASPGSLVEDTSGNLFGTTEFGGVGYTGYTLGFPTGDGTVFEWVKSSGTLSVLANFNGNNGAFPTGLVEDSSGNLFGTTNGGGANNDGTVFEWVKSSGTISILASFNGAAPVGDRLVEDSSGNLFGTTYGGGTNNAGTVFEWVKSSGTISDLASFNGSNGEYPHAGLVEDSSGNLFGTSSGGGTNNDGTVFELQPSPDTWTGNGSNNLWSNPDNWLGDSTPVAGDDLVFPNGAQQETNVNDLGFTFGAVTIADSYTISGQPLTVTGNVDFQQGSTELDCSATAGGTTSVDAGASLSIGAGATLDILSDAPASLNVAGTVSLLTGSDCTVNGDMSVLNTGVLNAAADSGLAPNAGTDLFDGLETLANMSNLTEGVGTNLDLGAGTLNLNGNANLSGNVMSAKGTNLTAGAGANIAFAPFSLFDTSGSTTLADGSQLTWGANATATVEAGATVNSSGTMTANSNVNLTVQGYFNLETGIFDANGNFTLATGGHFDMTAMATWTQESGSNAYIFGTVNNSDGTCQINVGASQTLESGSNYSLNGTLNCANGDFTLDGKAGNANGAYMDFGVKGKLTATGSSADVTIDAGATVNGSDGSSISVNAGILAVHGTVSGMISITDVFNGITVAAGGVLDEYGTLTEGVGGDLDVFGTVIIEPGAALDDFSTVTVEAGGLIDVSGTLSVAATGSLDIFGTVTVENGATYSPVGPVTVESGGLLQSVVAAATIKALQNVSTGSVLLATFSVQTDQNPLQNSNFSVSINWADNTGVDTTNYSLSISGNVVQVYGTHAYTTGGVNNVIVALTYGGAFTINAGPTINVANDVTSSAKYSQSAPFHDLAKGTYYGLYESTLTITNTSSAAINGNLVILLSGLAAKSPAVTLQYATVTIGGQTYNLAISYDSAGDPYVTVDKSILASLAKGGSLAVSMYFSETKPSFITYTPKLFSDPYDN